jgi:hypothetical protein
MPSRALARRLQVKGEGLKGPRSAWKGLEGWAWGPGRGWLSLRVEAWKKESGWKII